MKRQKNHGKPNNRSHRTGRKLTGISLALLLAAVLGVTAQAETFYGDDDWGVYFDGENMVSTFKTQDIDDAIYQMEPGDTAEIHLTLENKYSTATDWYMTNEVLQSLEDSQTVAEGGAYSYILTYVDADGETDVLYSSEEIGGETITDNGEEGLYQATSSLKNYFFLDTLESGAKGSIYLTVKLEGETQGNIYQDTLAQLQMNFAVELAATTNTPGGNTPRVVFTPKTGDASVILARVLILMAAGTVCIVLALRRQKKTQPVRINAGKQRGKTMLGLAVAVLLAIAPVRDVQAAENTYEYTYSVTLSSGKEGTFLSETAVHVESETATVSSSEDTIRIENLQYGDIVSFDASDSVSVNDANKYYVRGVRESGKDNNTSGTPAFTVKSDREYVVAYGIKGDMVAYTVNYQDADGNALAESRTYYGNTGDTPVVAYLYIDGYQPQAYNLTKTLVQNEAENIFTFVYTPVTRGSAAQTASQATGTTSIVGTGTTAGTGTDGTDAAGTTGGAGAAGTTGGTDAAGTTGDADATGTTDGTDAAGTANGTDGTTEIESSETPQENINLDEQQTPASDMSNIDGNRMMNRYLIPVFIILTGVAVAIIIIGVMKMRKGLRSRRLNYE